MAYRIYRSDDPGAVAAGLPILPMVAANTNIGTSGIAAVATILDAVLVNGYAGKPAAGWTKPFGSDGTRHLYLSGSATGAAIRLDTGLSTVSACDVSVMSNPTTLGHSAIIGTNVIRCGTRSGGAWVIFADEKSFMIYSRGDPTLSLTGGPWNLHYFGEMVNFESQQLPLSVGYIGSVSATSYSEYPGQWAPIYRSVTVATTTYPAPRINHSSASIDTIRIMGGPFFVGNGPAQYQVPIASTNGKVLASDVFLTANSSLLCKLRGIKTLESAFWGASNPLDILTLDGKKYAIIYVYSNMATTITSSSATEAMFLVEVE